MEQKKIDRINELAKKAKSEHISWLIQNKGLLLHTEIVIKVKLKGFQMKKALEFFRFFFATSP